MKRSAMPPRSAPMSRGKPTAARTALKATTATWKPRRDTGPSPRVRALVLARDGHACTCCGGSVFGQVYSIQHRKRRSQGGGNSLPNLITVLGDGTSGCHYRIDSRIDPHDEVAGYTVASWQDPASVPVLYVSAYGSGQMAWLTPDGGLAFECPFEPERAA